MRSPTLYRTDGTPAVVLTTDGQMVWGGTAVPAPVDSRPAPLDEMVAALRPAGRVIWTAAVAADGSGDYATVTEAADAARAAQADRVRADQQSGPTPHHTVQIIVGPGTYHEAAKLPPYCAIIGAGSGQTVLESSGVEALGVIAAQEGRCYVEGVTIRSTRTATSWTPKYPVHISASGTSVWVDVSYEVAVPGAEVYGCDGVQGGMQAFYRCAFGGPTNIHGWAGDTEAQTLAFVACTSTHAVGRVSGTDGTAPAPDETWVVGGELAEVAVHGPAAILHLDPSAQVGRVTGDAIRDGRTDWPAPYGGLSDAERDQYGISPST